MRATSSALVLGAALVVGVAAVHEDALPSYHYGAPIKVECMKRNLYVIYILDAVCKESR
jgi:hypothetical protein